MGEEGLVDELLRKGADPNMQCQFLKIREWSGGASVSARAVAIVAREIEFPNLGPQKHHEKLARDLLCLLISKISKPNEICKNPAGEPTCALNEALRIGSVVDVKLLLDRGADPNLFVEATRRYAISIVFCETLSRHVPNNTYPVRQMIEVLEKAGADYGNLDSYGLNTALACAAWAGLTTLVPNLLDCGADPDALNGSIFVTALGIAAASPRPEAPGIIHMLLEEVNVNRLPSRPRYGMAFLRAKCALDFPLWLMLDTQTNSKIHEPGHVECLHNWTRSASVLVAKGAVWDVDFAQWRKCLEHVEPEFASMEAKKLLI